MIDNLDIDIVVGGIIVVVVVVVVIADDVGEVTAAKISNIENDVVSSLFDSCSIQAIISMIEINTTV